MNARTLLLAASWVTLFAVSGLAVTNAPIRVFMPDGQIKSNLLRVYITEDITEADNPTLTLLAGKFLIEKLPSWAERTNAFRELARFQHWTETVDGLEISRTGTLLLFDLRKADFPFFKPWQLVTLMGISQAGYMVPVLKVPKNGHSTSPAEPGKSVNAPTKE